LHWIYTIFFLIVLIDVTMIRHFMCRFMCIYKVWQHTFKTSQTLHIAYDESRSDECAKCNYCATSCFLAIDPRKTEVYDTCINCGECVTACDSLHARKGQGLGLLKFAVGERQGRQFNEFKTSLSSLFGRLTWVLPIFVLGIGMFVYGLATYERYHIAAYRADTLQASQVLDYRISLANKFYSPAEFAIEIEGLPAGSYTLERSAVTSETAGRINVGLHLSPELPKGLHPFLVRVKTNDGWEDSFRVQHFAAGAL
jgi:polyferredoxin